ncbi:putative sarcosine-dimethylglycine methyltransferase [Roseibacterium elongatum DSM 19469]|uniref:Putative sarcosine-dimethylglycine methyltransferase n=2 Tax=Roseicyclus elongatus TaxID=159346 RepID=W8S963_9RHOB|nr:putative sarcosine-dimethylglycine methyltransferase [Roseibacterium elongatum DSM 19469]
MSALGTNAEAAAAYYDHGDVAAFYRRLWGGADIHIGLYDRDDVSVAEASRAMTGHLLDLAGFGRGSRVLDIACGYGGTLVALARRGCVAQGLDISTLCVTTARKTLAAAGLAEQVAVELGDFHALPCSDAAFDGAICQESLIHSNDRPRVFAEVFRVLRPGGTFAFFRYPDRRRRAARSGRGGLRPPRGRGGCDAADLSRHGRTGRVRDPTRRGTARRYRRPLRPAGRSAGR